MMTPLFSPYLDTQMLLGLPWGNLDQAVAVVLLALGVAYLAFGLDDLFIDACAFARRLRPERLTEAALENMATRPERWLAVIIPAWKEGDIIQRMLVGNLERLQYRRVHFFVGVYPNDSKTGEQVRAAAGRFSNIHAVDNDRPGPTSKGQILNHVVGTIRTFEVENNIEFDGLVMQDAEDMIHPLALRLMNRELDRFDFVQIPVFSLIVEKGQLVAGTYMDEFAELHTKDLLVRESLGAAVPSAGVGTAMSRPLVLALLAANDDKLFREATLTEDYDLGVRAKTLGFRSHFACCFFENKLTKDDEYIATREYFPKRFTRSVRQKTRWTIGIALQGWRNLGWIGGAADRYFLGRDRKGLVTNLLGLAGYPVLLYMLMRQVLDDDAFVSSLRESVLVRALLAANLVLMTNRLAQRMVCVNRVYGLGGALPVVLRWPVANAINAFACYAAIKTDVLARWRRTTIAWSKTEHELPNAFGDTSPPAFTGGIRRRRRVLPLLLLVGVGCASFASQAAGKPKCVQVYYDGGLGSQKPYYFGRQHAMMLQNLLGHFPHIQQYVSPIELYQSGDVERCTTTIYLGTYFDAKIPSAFFTDYVHTKKNVVWAGYNIWKLDSASLDSLWGVRYNRLATLDSDHRDAEGRPGFFKTFDYKGETFIKFGEWDRVVKTRFDAAFEISLFDATDDRMNGYVVSWAHHNTQDRKAPYILRNGNHWYVGDSPFSFTTEEDRYLIFADLLFDALDEPPRRPAGQPKPAVLRFEDIHPRLDQWELYRMVNRMQDLHVKFCMSVIPIFVDPFGLTSEDPLEQYVPMTASDVFMDFLKYAADRGVRFMYHGVTHQGGYRRNPFSGITGDDFEFWDRVANRPMPEDSPAFVVNRIEDGLALFDKAHIVPFAWLTPHYQASPLDYVIFGQLFRWNVGRIIYFPFKKQQATPLPAALAMDVSGVAGNGKRLKYFSDLKVDYPQDLLPTGQFFPYEIFNDVYGQRIIPENIGNVQPYMNEQVYKTETLQQLLDGFKRNRVIRDSWGSFFFHPFMLDTTANDGLGTFPGDMSKLETIIKTVRAYGYEFIDIKAWADANVETKHLIPIERTVGAPL